MIKYNKKDLSKFLEENNLVLMDSIREDIVVSNNLKEILEEKELNYSEFARIIGESRQVIHAVINNKYKPGVEFALKASICLDKPIDELFQLKDEAWIRNYIKNDTAMYLNVMTLEVISNIDRKKEIKATGNEYFNIDTPIYQRLGEKPMTPKN